MNSTVRPVNFISSYVSKLLIRPCQVCSFVLALFLSHMHEPQPEYCAKVSDFCTIPYPNHFELFKKQGKIKLNFEKVNLNFGEICFINL